MKTKTEKHSPFQKLMIVIVPIIVMLLIASIVTLVAMFFTHNFGKFGMFSPGNIVIIMSSCSALLAIAGIVLAIITAGRDPDDAEDTK